MGEYLDTQSMWQNTHMDNVPAWTPRRRRSIVTVGAGFSALIFAHKLQHEQPELQDLVDHTIYEARSDIGGTWLVNRYPGVQCDVPAHVYVWIDAWDFRKNPPLTITDIPFCAKSRVDSLLRNGAANTRLHEGYCQELES